MNAAALEAMTGARSRPGLAVTALGIALVLAPQAGALHRLEDAAVFGADWTPASAEAYGYVAGSADLLLVKYGHALRSPRFRDGLFGSSRGMSISHRHIGLKESESFNFSTGSTGFRQSVALIQARADASKLTGTLLLTIDNFGISYLRQIDWPTVFMRPYYHLVYLREEIAIGANPLALARAGARFGR